MQVCLFLEDVGDEPVACWLHGGLIRLTLNEPGLWALSKLIDAAAAHEAFAADNACRDLASILPCSIAPTSLGSLLKKFLKFEILTTEVFFLSSLLT
jgi:hypothetical protein